MKKDDYECIELKEKNSNFTQNENNTSASTTNNKGIMLKQSSFNSNDIVLCDELEIVNKSNQLFDDQKSNSQLVVDNASQKISNKDSTVLSAFISKVSILIGRGDLYQRQYTGTSTECSSDQSKSPKPSVIDSIKVNHLRVIYMNLLVIAFITSFFLFSPISSLYINFNNRCPLYSTITISISQSIVTNQTNIDIDSANTIWSKPTICEYCMSTGVLVTFYSIISFFFFIVFNMEDIVDSDHCLLIPWLILSFLLNILLFASVCMITRGFYLFCNSMASTSTISSFDYCKNAQYYEWKSVDASGFYNKLLMATISSWLLLFVFIFINTTFIIRLLLESKQNKQLLLTNVAIAISKFQNSNTKSLFIDTKNTKNNNNNNNCNKQQIFVVNDNNNQIKKINTDENKETKKKNLI